MMIGKILLLCTWTTTFFLHIKYTHTRPVSPPLSSAVNAPLALSSSTITNHHPFTTPQNFSHLLSNNQVRNGRQRVMSWMRLSSQDVSGCFSPRTTRETTTMRCVGRALRSGLSLSYSQTSHHLLSLSWIMPRITGKF